ncbi:MAG TPA: magnesium transporter CorA family protein [Bacilli bacterium]|jgi:magnesium transporter|nr:MAG: Magnesium transport protein CorA [Tenericutes bacterium ADurb.Bin140]HOE77816.1 magnesium transporter CorA family protein [Bacilli bacterium]HOR95344.1 magnesium transporter CorA family protein [Bacilli bacterium]HPD11828.1 magnesium transporter CorA family protein [Bacilli bacterium]HPK58020.1 magnesium transporter CorA family protein [Bacilli bacterium]
MITVYLKTETRELTIHKNIGDIPIEPFLERKSWIHLKNPTEEEIDLVVRKTGIGKDLLRIALDEEETAHIDFENGVTMLIVDTPVLENDSESSKYLTTPFGIFFNEDYFVTLCLKENMVEGAITSRGMKNFSTGKHVRLTIQLLYQNAIAFVNIMKLINKDSEAIERRLHQSMRNKELFELMNLGKSLVYLSTGINANQLVLERFKRLDIYKKFEEDIALLEDALIENRQAMEMCSVHRDILNGTMDAFASIINNNVNHVMKTLTVVTIVLTIPTLVASFFGMNVNIPFAQDKLGFLYAVLISAVIAVICAWALIRYTNPRR